MPSKSARKPAKKSVPAPKKKAARKPAAKAVKPIPDGYHTVTPYLIVPGVDRVLDFVQKAFGATITTPPMRGPDGKIGHAEVRIGTSRVMMGEASDRHPAMPAMLNLYVKDCDALFEKAVAAGGTMVMPLTDHFYGDRSGGVRDPAGNQWFVSTHKEDVPPAEMARRAAEFGKKQQQQPTT
jgi:PhnB protein